LTEWPFEEASVFIIFIYFPALFLPHVGFALYVESSPLCLFRVSFPHIGADLLCNKLSPIFFFEGFMKIQEEDPKGESSFRPAAFLISSD